MGFHLAASAAGYAAQTVPLASDPSWMDARTAVHLRRAGAPPDDEPAQRAARASAFAERIGWQNYGIAPEDWTPPADCAAVIIRPLRPDEREQVQVYGLAAATDNPAGGLKEGVTRHLLRLFGWIGVEQGGKRYDPDEFIALLDAMPGGQHHVDAILAEVAAHISRISWLPPAGKERSGSPPGSSAPRAADDAAPAGAT